MRLQPSLTEVLIGSPGGTAVHTELERQLEARKAKCFSLAGALCDDPAPGGRSRARRQTAHQRWLWVSLTPAPGASLGVLLSFSRWLKGGNRHTHIHTRRVLKDPSPANRLLQFKYGFEPKNKGKPLSYSCFLSNAKKHAMPFAMSILNFF